MPVLTVFLALIAAGAFATATVLQQSRAHWHAVDAGRGRDTRRHWLPVWGVLGRIARDPVWRVGVLVNAVGFCVHALALHRGPIAVVQAVLVAQLLLAIVISDLRRHTRPTHREWLGAAVVCVGVGLIVVQRARAGQRIPHESAWLVYLAGAATAILILLTLARYSPAGWPRGVLVGLGAGVCFTTTAVTMTVVTARLSQFGLPGLWDWSVLAVILSWSSRTHSRRAPCPYR